MHRKGQGPRSLRIRHQSLDRHDAEAFKGGQFALNAMALPGNPYDGHTLKTIIPAMQDTIGADIERILADAGYPSAMRSVVATATTRPTATGSESSPPARNAA